MRSEKRQRIGYLLALAWLIFTVSLASWWLIFGLSQADELRRIDEDRFESAHKMLLWEGAVLIISLVAGGAALLYYIRQELLRHRAIEEFFAAFTHDLRTSLASLRLQVESLQEDMAEKHEYSPLLNRLLKDSVRLQLQLDNSLFFANLKTGRLYIERLSLARIIESIRPDFSDLEIRLEQDAQILADARAIESVLRNLLQNSVVHGEAELVRISVERVNHSRVRIVVEDDGKGPVIEPARLGKLFYRPTTKSGAGVGLYISRKLVKRMQGTMDLGRGDRGFTVIVELQEAAG